MLQRGNGKGTTDMRDGLDNHVPVSAEGASFFFQGVGFRSRCNQLERLECSF